MLKQFFFLILTYIFFTQPPISLFNLNFLFDILVFYTILNLFVNFEKWRKKFLEIRTTQLLLLFKLSFFGFPHGEPWMLNTFLTTPSNGCQNYEKRKNYFKQWKEKIFFEKKKEYLRLPIPMQKKYFFKYEFLLLKLALLPTYDRVTKYIMSSFFVQD